MQPLQLDWIEPLRLAARCQRESCWVFLHSGQAPGALARQSFLAVFPREVVEGTKFSDFSPDLHISAGPFDPAWFGYFSYELAELERKAATLTPAYVAMPRLWMAKFSLIYQFDHTTKQLFCWHDQTQDLTNAPHHWPDASCDLAPPALGAVRSNMSKAEYLAHVETVLEAIHAGSLYQANITRKFFGEFSARPNPWSIFTRLCYASPAPYSAYLQLAPGRAIVSSSPEQFLHFSADGMVETRPIKGSAPRASDDQEDRAIAHILQNSAKERAENLMITDLMRNDLARSCVAGSVKTPALYELSSYATVHHLSSTVQGQRMPEFSTLDVLRHAFPPGSMTGAPKRAAVALCEELEAMERGVYSGVLGWLGSDGSGEFSVVIRTLLVDGIRFEFQAGGGIVADSNPEAEWQETLVKTRGICAALGITSQSLALL